MDCEFSEFSYGFAIASELVARLRPLKVAPIFPSLLAEAKLGWDLKLEQLTGTVLFVQFKVPFACTRRSALEWEFYGGPYFRLHVRRLRHSTQHNRLKRLSKKQPNVFYIAPRFFELSSFNKKYLDSQVLSESLMISLRSLPFLVDNDQHSICYQSVSSARWFSSNPEEITAQDHETFTRLLYDAVVTTPVQFSKQRLVEVRSDLLEAIGESEFHAGLSDVRSFEDVVRDIVHLGRTYFNAEPMFLTKME